MSARQRTSAIRAMRSNFLFGLGQAFLVEVVLEELVFFTMTISTSAVNYLAHCFQNTVTIKVSKVRKFGEAYRAFVVCGSEIIAVQAEASTQTRL